MKRHNGMRPQDVIILLSICSFTDQNWMMKDIAKSLRISPSEVSDSIQRSYIGGLIDKSKRSVAKSALLDFMTYGIRYVFPVHKGTITRGVPTASSAPMFEKSFMQNEILVWPDPKGTARGIALEPLIPNLSEVVKENLELYKLLSLLEMLRLGQNREREFAIKQFRTAFRLGE